MIRFDDVSFRYEGAPGPALRHVTFHLREGEFALVVGRTGSGKSTLLRAMTGLVPHFTGGRMSGRVVVAGRDTRTHQPREFADLVGVVGQDPVAGFVTDTVEEELAYTMEQLAVAPAVMRKRVEETLDLLGIAELRDRPLRALSGGQQQRVAIGAVLTAQPRVLVLDEPTSALDPTAAEEVLAAIARLVHDLGITAVVAEHRLERVAQFADVALSVPGDGSVTCGPPAQVLAGSAVAPPVVRLGQALGWAPPPLTVRDARRLAAPLRERLAGAGVVPDAATHPTLPQPLAPHASWPGPSTQHTPGPQDSAPTPTGAPTPHQHFATITPTVTTAQQAALSGTADGPRQHTPTPQGSALTLTDNNPADAPTPHQHIAAITPTAAASDAALSGTADGPSQHTPTPQGSAPTPTGAHPMGAHPTGDQTPHQHIAAITPTAAASDAALSGTPSMTAQHAPTPQHPDNPPAGDRAMGTTPLQARARHWWWPRPRAARAAQTEADSQPTVLGNRQATSEHVALRATGVRVCYGPLVAVRDVTVELHPGRVLALMGRNGSGKSSLLWALQGTGRRDGGAIAAGPHGLDPGAVSRGVARALVGLVPQNATDLLYHHTVADECAAADAEAGAAEGTTQALWRSLVRGGNPAAHPRDLSEGQRLALVLAIQLAGAPPVMLLDEPTRGLDYPAKARLAAHLRALAAQGTALVIATHDVEFVAETTDDVAVMAQGEIVAQGPAREVIAASPAFAPQVAKVMAPLPYLTLSEVVAAAHTQGAAS